MQIEGPHIVTLELIARSWPIGGKPRVPQWALGAVKRLSITFATGPTDDRTRVHWVQSHAMTGDIRINPTRPQIDASTRLEDLDHDSLVALASVEGGVAATSWDDGVMRWADWIGFQPYDKYPEPGILHRIGPCMIELAPSGIYVEDWRFQPSAPGIVCGLRLLSEVTRDGEKRARAGGLVIAGDHAIMAVARRQELPSGIRAQDFVKTSADPVGAIHRVLDCTVDYAARRGDAFRIVSSTDPRREGGTLLSLGEFKTSGETGVLEQRLPDGDEKSARAWSVDSLEADVAFPLATNAPEDRIAWLSAEADTLLAPIERERPRGS